MAKRRPCRAIISSSDEEDEDHRLHPSPPPPPPPPPPQPQHNRLQDEEMDDLFMDDIDTEFQTVTLNSAHPTPGSNGSVTATATSTSTSTTATATSTTATFTQGNRQFEPIPLDISDEDPEEITIGDSTDNSFPEIGSGNSGYFEVSESPVHGVLERLGLRLRREWLDSCLQVSVQGFQRLDDSAKAKLCFQQFLLSDMNFCGAGVLPPNVHTLHLVDLKGPFVLQVDEVVNISSSLRGRYQNAAPGIKRCLKLSMTDGVQRVFGMEYRTIKDLQPLGPSGLKVVVCNVNIRRGILMLVPEVVEVLGGIVDELEAARQRLVAEVNKPPRGRRNRTGEVVPLTTRATNAAWPRNNNAVPENADRNPPTNVIPLQSSRQGSAASEPARRRQAFATPFSRNSAVPNTSHAPSPPEQDQIRGPTETPIVTHPGQGPDRDRQDIEVLVNKSNAEPCTVSGVHPLQSAPIGQHISEPSIEVTTPLGGTRQGTPANYMPEEDVHLPVSGGSADLDTSSVYMDADEISLVDDLERHFMLSRDKEVPFTYLASLSANCVANDDETSVVRGKIKCIITAVKEFQYRHKTTYGLRVYVDDGSLISEILIDHNAVQNQVGYSPQEVTSALTSPDIDRVNRMKEIMKQFQIFLVDFEGTMIVEMNKASFVPVAVEMKKGFPASDAWLLLERVKSFCSPQQHDEPYRSPQQHNEPYHSPQQHDEPYRSPQQHNEPYHSSQQHNEPYLNCIDLSP